MRRFVFDLRVTIVWRHKVLVLRHLNRGLLKRFRDREKLDLACQSRMFLQR